MRNLLIFLLFYINLTSSEIQQRPTPSLISSMLESATFYYGGKGLGSAANIFRFCSKICEPIPAAKGVSKEFEILDKVCYAMSQRFFKYLLQKEKTSPFASWNENRDELSKIPVVSEDTMRLVHFLEKRWLSKSNGFYSAEVEFVTKCFGMDLQVHPNTSNSYTRDPRSQISLNYKNSVESWKKRLPEPHEFPLVLTRPCNPKNHLPNLVTLNCFDAIESLEVQPSQKNAKICVDLTPIFEKKGSSVEWLKTWEAFKKTHLAPGRNGIETRDYIFFQNHEEHSLGGLRILPIHEEETESDYRFLLEWVSHNGLSANQVELDRWPTHHTICPINKSDIPTIEPKANFLGSIDSVLKECETLSPQLQNLLRGTLKILKGLIDSIEPEQWSIALECPTKNALLNLIFRRIIEQFQALQGQEKPSLFETAQKIEVIHANLSSLLEIFSPLKHGQYPTIAKKLLTSIPKELQECTSYGLHPSAMTTLGAVFKAVQTSSQKDPLVLMGENSYFECVHVFKEFAKAKLTSEADDRDYRDVDLLLLQFNPVWKPQGVQAYELEDVYASIDRALAIRNNPLTIALDFTLDTLNSFRNKKLLETYRHEIENGRINMIFFRSGLKFDLFGMDNYCGAPFFMINNGSPFWSAFEQLFVDPVLQTDRLSYDWFCLSFQNASEELREYQIQILKNTREILDQIPESLFHTQAKYRVIPVARAADPSFIDIHVSGPFHRERGAALIGGLLYLRSMESGHPIFYRRSLGFYHPNFGFLANDQSSTIRLTVGLDPKEVDVFVKALSEINECNL